MKRAILICVLTSVILSCNSPSKNQTDHQQHNHKSEKVSPSSKKTLSPNTYEMAMLGETHIHIDYSAPSVRGRIIFGGLLAYGEVWQSGAHNATWIETNKDLLIHNNTLKAGKYGFFTIPNKNNWTIIFNKNWQQHGKDEYDENDDVLRFEVPPGISEEIIEKLTYRINKTNEKEGTISLSWEKIIVEFPFSILE